jgi:hypothetical protein
LTFGGGGCGTDVSDWRLNSCRPQSSRSAIVGWFAQSVPGG